MKTKRTHPYKITSNEAESAWKILDGPGKTLEKLKKLLTIETPTPSGRMHRIGQGVRNDIQRIIDAAEKK